MTLDAGGDIILDADGTDIILKDGGTSFGSFKRVSSDFVIKAEAQDKDIVFKGNDGGATITPMTIDMSEGGKIGVNTSSPEEKISVSNGAIQLENNQNLTWSDIGDGNTGRVRIYGSEDSDFIRMNVDNSNDKSFALTGTGVGIGNLNPTKKLTVAGEISSSLSGNNNSTFRSRVVVLEFF